MAERAILYARISGLDKGLSLQSQLEMCREHAQKRQYRIVKELSEDEETGYEINLPKLMIAREMAQAGSYDVLVVRELDRLSRNLAKQLIVEQELKRYGVRVEYALQDYPDTPEGRLQKHLRASIAEYEREKIAERTLRGRELSVRQGNVLVFNRPPYGYEVVKGLERTTLKIVPTEAAVVERIFTWFVDKNVPAYRIAKFLSEDGVPTWQDIHQSPTTAKVRRLQGWSVRSVINILHNETYTGTWRWGHTQHTTEVPSIISYAKWQGAKQRLAENKSLSRGRTLVEALMARRLTCGICGRGVSTQAGSGVAYHYYRCNSGKLPRSERCSLPLFRGDQVDEAVWHFYSVLLRGESAEVERVLKAAVEVYRQSYTDLLLRVDDIEGLILHHTMEFTQLMEALKHVESDRAKAAIGKDADAAAKILEDLENVRHDLVQELEDKVFTDAQLKSAQECVREMCSDLDLIEDSFEVRLGIIQRLDVVGELGLFGKRKGIKVSSRVNIPVELVVNGITDIEKEITLKVLLYLTEGKE